MYKPTTCIISNKRYFGYIVSFYVGCELHTDSVIFYFPQLTVILCGKVERISSIIKYFPNKTNLNTRVCDLLKLSEGPEILIGPLFCSR